MRVSEEVKDWFFLVSALTTGVSVGFALGHVLLYFAAYALAWLTYAPPTYLVN